MHRSLHLSLNFQCISYRSRNTLRHHTAALTYLKEIRFHCRCSGNTAVKSFTIQKAKAGIMLLINIYIELCFVLWTVPPRRERKKYVKHKPK